MTESDIKANFHNLLMQTSNAGHQAFRMIGGEPHHACPDCDAPYPQTDVGWKALQEHKMVHGRPMPFGAPELVGKTLTILVVETDDTDECLGDEEYQPEYDIYGQDGEGNIYYLSSHGRWDDGEHWKWKRQRFPLKSLLAPTPSAAE